MKSDEPAFLSLAIGVLTITDTRTLESDTSGSALIERIGSAGHRLAARALVRDNRYAIRACVSAWVADPRVQAIITTGGTGLTGRDGTPEAIAPLLDKVIDGFGEMFRACSLEEIGTSTLQSRALAGVANGTVIFCIPGSTGACRTAWDRIIVAQLDARTRPCNLVELMPRMLER